MRLLSEALKGVFRRPATRNYPKKKPFIPDGFRGRVEHNPDTCTYCMLCAINCPATAITIDREKKEWKVDTGKCIFCGRCQDVCPTSPKSVKLSKKYDTTDYDRENLKKEY